MSVYGAVGLQSWCGGAAAILRWLAGLLQAVGEMRLPEKPECSSNPICVVDMYQELNCNMTVPPGAPHALCSYRFQLAAALCGGIADINLFVHKCVHVHSMITP